MLILHLVSVTLYGWFTISVTQYKIGLVTLNTIVSVMPSLRQSDLAWQNPPWLTNLVWLQFNLTHGQGHHERES